MANRIQSNVEHYTIYYVPLMWIFGLSIDQNLQSIVSRERFAYLLMVRATVQTSVPPFPVFLLVLPFPVFLLVLPFPVFLLVLPHSQSSWI
jgi:hypothetical protein